MKFQIEIEAAQYPPGVIRQAIANALEHEIIGKDYAETVTVREMPTHV